MCGCIRRYVRVTPIRDLLHALHSTYGDSPLNPRARSQRMPARSYSTPDSHGNDVSALHLRHTAAIQDHILERVAANAPGVLNGVELGLVEPAISTPAAASATASEASVCWDCGQSHSSHPTLDFQQYLWFIEAMQDQMYVLQIHDAARH